MTKKLIIPTGLSPDSTILDDANEYLEQFKTHEISQGGSLVLYFDERSAAYYLLSHLDGKTLASKCDTDAVLDPDEGEDYRLNREISVDKAAYIVMASDALKSRSFEDLVVEYDTSYKPEKPLKVYGGQHRIQAIKEGAKVNVSAMHGVRTYFCLSREQKVDIATVNNTSIAVASDLLDRMQEQLLGTDLRDWCQSVGLLGTGEDFADSKSQDIPTVRIVRTLLVNFYRGIDADDDAFHEPIICKSGSNTDKDYLNLLGKIEWTNSALGVMGQEFSRLHKIQGERVYSWDKKDWNAEFARKALSMSVAASWAYAAGYFQRNPEYLRNHYQLTDSTSPPHDPLNAKALSQASFKLDPENYRGLGARNDAKELGRMLEVFIVQATLAKNRGINKTLANAAIQSYEAKKATYSAHKALGRI